MFTVKRVAAFAVLASAGLCADVLLTGETEYNVVKGASQNITEKITGTGSIKKTGQGTLVLKNGENDFSGGVSIVCSGVNPSPSSYLV